jgi:O-antigen ligase
MERSQLRLLAVSELISLRVLGLAAFCLLAFSLPFELERPLLTLGIISLTNVELLLFLTLLLAFLAVLKEKRWRQEGWLKVPKLWLVLLGLFALALTVSALLAPEFKSNAAKATFRSVTGLALALAVPQLFYEKRQLRLLVAALLLGGLLSVGLGLAEVWLDQTFSILSLFRNQPTVAGPFVRLSGSFNHANQTAMFIEATLPFLVAVVWLFGRKRNWLPTVLGIVLIVLYIQASFLTYSRSSFVTIFVSFLAAAVMLWLWHPNRRRLAYFWGVVSGLVVLMIAFNTLVSPVLRLRLSSEGDNEWYNVSFDVPEHFEIEAGDIQPVAVSVTNEGSLVWSSHAEKPINLGGRWYRLSDNMRSDNEMRWTLDKDVAPGETLQTTVPMVAPTEAGEYEFEWDLVQEGVVWFSLRNGLRFTSNVTVVPATGETIDREPDNFSSAEPLVQPIPGRRVLWAIAAQQFVERPILGIGLDNFRLTYGEEMGWQAWNDSIHTNNWYIETAVSVGLLGSVPFFGWLTLLGLNFINRMRSKRINIWQIALLSGLLAFLIHGLLDYFLLFNGTGLLFWIFVGMWMMLAWPERSA